MIPLSIPNFEGNEVSYVNKAVSQGWVSTGGEYVSEMERNLASYLKAEDVLVCQSGTSALHLALIEAGVGRDDVVIVPTLTFIAAVNPVRYQGATPVFMDCDDSLCMNAVKLRRFCEEECSFSGDVLLYNDKAVKAIIIVHVFGNMADMETIMDIAATYHLVVIEDATEALGTCYTSGKFEGKYAGTIGDYGAYSFNGNKIITTGGGGALTAKDAKKVQHMRYLSTQAKDDAQHYLHNEIGYNYRMTNVQAAIGVAQLEMLPEFIRRKNANYRMYLELFEGYEKAKLLSFRENTWSNCWFYSLLFEKGSSKLSIYETVDLLQEKGIQTRAVWGLIHRQKPYADSVAYQIEQADSYASRILNIPSSTQLTEDDIRYVVQQIRENVG